MKITITFFLTFFLFSNYISAQITVDSVMKKQGDSLVKIPTDTLIKAPKDTSWKQSGFIGFNFNNVQLTNWAAGGQNATSIASLFSYNINYKKHFLRAKKIKTMTWDNSINLAYGVIRTDKDPWRKNEDKIDLNSKYGYDAFGKWYYAALLNFKTQFANGYQEPNDSVRVSKFMAPAWLILSLGLDWKPKDYFSFYISPATGKFTYVYDDSLSAHGAFGVEPGKRYRPEFGAYVKIQFKKDIFKNVNLTSKLDLFNNYTDKKKYNRKNIDVNWENTLLMKVNKFISCTAFVHIIYDDDINIKHEVKEGGITVIKEGPVMQYKQVFGVSMAYKF